MKIADGSEASASITGTVIDGDTLTIGKILAVFRPDNPATLAAGFDPNTEGTTSNPTAQVVNASGGNVPLVVIGCYTANPNPVNPRTFTPAKDGEIDGAATGLFTTDMWLAFKIYNSAPADVTIDMDDEGTNTLSSCWIEVS